VPLVKLHGDLPAYFIDFHRDVPKNSINLYQAREFVRFRKKWLPEALCMASLIPPMPMVPMDRGNVDISVRKSGSLFFIKNGNSTDELEKKWEVTLPRHVADLTLRMARDLIENHLKSGPPCLGDWVSDYLTDQAAMDIVPRPLIWFFTAQMDDYMRRAKSTCIAQALLDFPVVVQGDFWDHLDFNGRRARHVPGTDVFSSQRVVAEQLGVIDMSANVDTWPHDRVQRAAGSFSLVLTNEQTWLTTHFPDFSDLTFEFDAEAIAARVADVLGNKDRYLEAALAFGERFRSAFPRSAFNDRVSALVANVRWLWQDPREQIQDFLVWTKTP
jgi:hypothetical protein